MKTTGGFREIWAIGIIFVVTQTLLIPNYYLSGMIAALRTDSVLFSLLNIIQPKRQLMLCYMRK